MSDLEPRGDLLNPTTGEVLPATPENAARMIATFRDLRAVLRDQIAFCEAILVEESRRAGTKTLRVGELTAVVRSDSETTWDVEALRAALEKAGCPEERLDALIRTTVEYRVDGNVARQLAAANPEYARAIESAKTRRPKPTHVSVH